MQTYPKAALDAMDEGREVIIGLIRFDLGSGTYGFAKGPDPFPHDGITYQPSSVISVSELAMAPGTVAEGFTVELAASADDGLTPEVLSTIHDEDTRDRPVTVLDAMLDPDTNALLAVKVVKRGYIDTIDHVIDADRGDLLIAHCESRALDYSRRNGRQANSADQARRSSTDTFFDHASSVGRIELDWGK